MNEFDYNNAPAYVDVVIIAMLVMIVTAVAVTVFSVCRSLFGLGRRSNPTK